MGTLQSLCSAPLVMLSPAMDDSIGGSFTNHLTLHGFVKLCQVTAYLRNSANSCLTLTCSVAQESPWVHSQLHQFPVKICDAVVIAAFALETDDVGVSSPPEIERIIWVAEGDAGCG